MRCFILTCLLASAPLWAQSLDSTEWLAMKNRYLAQTVREAGYDYSTKKRTEPEITFDQLLSALPPTEQWDGLTASLRRQLEAEDQASPNAIDNALLLTLLEYINGENDKAATAQSLSAIQKRWEKMMPTEDDDVNERYYAAMQINENLLSVIHSLSESSAESLPDSPNQDIQHFEQQLANLEPMNKEGMAKMVGGKENLAKLEAYLEEMEEFHTKLYKQYADVEFTEETVAAYQKAAEEFYNQNKAMADLMEKLLEDPQTHGLLDRLTNENLDANREDYLHLPNNLVKSVGNERATKLINRTLALPVSVFASDEETRALAKKLAIEQVEQLQVAQWALVGSMEDKAFFEAMSERFPLPTPPAEDDYSQSYEEYQEALAYYASALFAEGDTQGAALAYTQVTEDVYFSEAARKVINTPENMESAWRMFKAVVIANPESPYWYNVESLAKELGREQEMYELASQQAAAGKLPIETLFSAYDAYTLSLINQDNIEEAIAIYRKSLALLSEENAAERIIVNERFYPGYSANGALELGMVLKNQALIDLGLEILEAAVNFKRSLPPQNDYGLDYDEHPLLEAYIDLENYEAAEQLALAEIDYVRQLLADTKGDEYKMEYARENADEFIANLMGTYIDALYGQQRYADILNALNTSPNWNTRYLSDYLGNIYVEDIVAKVAYAMHVQGQSEDAVELLKWKLLNDDDDDQLYEVLVDLEGENAIPFLDHLARINRFEERPLIWKARVLLDAGKVNEAEAIITQAITMDPSDGDQGKGDRMRVYAVMGDIRAAQGNTKEAEFFDNVLQSIRLSEDADDFYYAGLHNVAISMYEEALTYFFDAYCIQSRLAVRLMEEGREAEAIEHYAKAFELMPDSFGRIESHCFGCEGAFSGKIAQQLAEQAFQKVMREDPNDPQAYYLMAYLRMDQGQYEEAKGYLMTAVELDPEYINAWNKLAGLTDTIDMDEALIEAIHQAQLRLDPLGRHSYVDFSQINNFKQLWPAMVESAALKAESSQKPEIYALAGVQIEEDAGEDRHFYERPESVGTMLIQNRTIASIGEIITLIPAATETAKPNEAQ